MADRFCAICECALGEQDSEHVCRSCFRKAREPKETVVQMSDEGARNLGMAYAFGNFVNWGIQKLIEVSGAKIPPPPKTPEEAKERELKARQQLKDIQKKLDEDRRKSKDRE